ncbi:DotU/TssL family secretion system protein [Serratia proteamaculans]|jgi:type VI secretion system protein ImpK|uniref:DotU/TssL family secretion system protein n=1 Tax=Serratia proteamaculans TaxID=28151 RepID=UPI000D9D0765|nr:DotU/TssL family secretion system protein [Serratia proteamaculans]SPZ52643.1 Root adhesin [Serratia quinivorans]CAI0904270.1 Root adhesin [Serratia proteamaculans]CAI0974970.1 Root adhesin [Serratia proteamaculans]CAI1060154.1 Root adhesin [Serratia proteamaculans]CAI1967053.1 Root adhesin [Serratia proteamaculans]
MNEFERKMREAMAATRNKAYPQLPSAEAGKIAAEIAGLSLGARALAAKMRPGSQGNPAGAAHAEPAAGESEFVTAATGEPHAVAQAGEAASGSVNGLFGRAALSRPGVMMGHWDNALIAAAIPVLLQVERGRDQGQLNPAAVRAQMVREIQQFQQSLLKEHITPDDVDKLAYLLCSYVDECCMSTLEAGTLNLSLLVEFYRDAWGGEKCFDHLQGYLAATPRDKDILAFYDLVLSLGFEGKFHVMERGAVLLADVRNHLDSYLYSQDPTQTLADAKPERVTHRVSRVTPIKLLGYGMLLALLTYGSAAWYLHEQSRALRNAILAWTPPIPRKINIMETLPQPLPQILREGWLEVRADPRGWLLIFTSDGAFANGKSTLSEEFKQKRNIERLGEALAPWPGDLEVIGHTDNTQYRKTSNNSNLKLSEARAQTVAEKLRESLVNSKYNRTVTSVGKGDAEPLDDNATEEGRRRNRRVDILWKIGEREISDPPADLNKADVAAAPGEN